MKTLLKLTAAIALFTASVGAQAELLATDYLTLGDAKSTLDTNTGLEWLDLTETDGMSLVQLENGVDTLFPGWRLPTQAEVTTLMMNALPDKATWFAQTSSSAWFHNNDPLDQQVVAFQSFFGLTAPGTHDYSVGLVKNDAGNASAFGAIHDKSRNDSVLLYSNVFSSTDRNFTNYNYGVFLVSDGGTTLSSINNPNINTPGFSGDVNTPADVSAPIAFGATTLLFGLGGALRRRQ